MVNQQKIIPMGILHGVTVDIERAHVIADFEVIEIVDDVNPYLKFLGIDWAFDMNRVTNLKNHSMTFEKKELGVIFPLDSTEGARYTKPIRDYYKEEDIKKIYNLILRDEN